MSQLTTRERFEAILAAEKKLAAKKAALKAQLAALSNESPGMQALLDAVQSTAELNKTSVAEVVKAVAKLKRTGLKIEKPTHKPKAPKNLD